MARLRLLPFSAESKYGIGGPSVGSKSTCEGGYLGLFDMSGNAPEWEDSCNGQTGPNDGCFFRGGSHGGELYALECSTGSTTGRSVTYDSIGFRCCAE